LGWIYHLLGNNEKANELLAAAVQAGAQNAEIHLHLAIVSADLGQVLQASTELSRALQLDPKLESSEEVKQLRTKLKGPLNREHRSRRGSLGRQTRKAD
jgi:tetratricopeptide (TPR) repeat protein